MLELSMADKVGGHALRANVSKATIAKSRELLDRANAHHPTTIHLQQKDYTKLV